MSSRRTSFVAGLRIACLLAFVVTSCTSTAVDNSRGGTLQSPKTLAELESQIAQALADAPATQLAKVAEGVSLPETQIVDGIEVSASDVKWADDQLTLDVCFTIPNQNPDWTIRRAFITTEDVIVSNWETSVLEIRLPPQNGQQEIHTFAPDTNFTRRLETVAEDASGKRCDRFSFSLPQQPRGPFTFSINAIAEYPKEGRYCEHLARVQASLKIRGLDFTIHCSEENGDSQVFIATKPENLSQTEAEAMVFSDKWYTRQGPWEFVLEVGQLP